MDGFKLLEHIGLELDLPVISTPFLLSRHLHSCPVPLPSYPSDVSFLMVYC